MLMAIALTVGSVEATSIDEIEQQREETRTKKSEAQQLLDDLKSQQSDILESAEEIDGMIMELQSDIDQANLDLENTQQQISLTEEQLAEAKLEEEAQYELLKQHIQNAYENSTYTYLDALFYATDFSEVVNNAEYIEQINDYDMTALNALIEVRTTIANKEALLAVSKDDLETLLEQSQDDQDALQLLYDAKQVQIENYNSSIEEAQALVDQLDALEASQDAQIAALEAAALAAASGETDGPTEFTGTFVWPMPASTAISSSFGNRTSPTAGASSNHRGVDIPCPVGSTVIAAAGGTVIYSGYLSTAGLAVLIDHGNGITTMYYHLSQPLVSVGDKVSQSQTIALSGNTGVTTGPHLHFGMRINGQYQNPLNFY
jgi:murein DD-endopeptidase MepM/ murein hydrolase activator NlpD